MTTADTERPDPLAQLRVRIESSRAGGLRDHIALKRDLQSLVGQAQQQVAELEAEKQRLIKAHAKAVGMGSQLDEHRRKAISDLIAERDRLRAELDHRGEVVRHGADVFVSVDVTGRVHVLKTWPEYFTAAAVGVKPFEVRRNTDRAFNVGDVLELREWDPATQAYTSRSIRRVITYVMTNVGLGVRKGFAALGLAPEVPE